MSHVVFSKAALNPLALPIYEGIKLAAVTLVDSEAAAGNALAALSAADVLGFDTESKPTFRKGEVSTGPHLVQLATEERVYLFQVTQLAGSLALKALLEAPKVLKVGLGLGNDRSVLQARLGIELNNVLDLGEALRSPAHPGTVGAKVAVASFFGQRFLKSKKTGTSNWASRYLTERQLLYAADDAHVALRLYRAWSLTQVQASVHR